MPRRALCFFKKLQKLAFNNTGYGLEEMKASVVKGKPGEAKRLNVSLSKQGDCIKPGKKH